MIIEQIQGNLRNMELEGCSVDYVILSADELQKHHQKLRTASGESIKLSLEEGQTLKCGDILKQEKGRIIAVDLKEEKVFELRPKSKREWAKAAFNIGNMHQKLYLYDEYLRVPYDPVLERLMELLGIEYTVKTEKLDGILANVKTGHSAHHSHHHE
ncbi:MAG: urease accessory protein UreE [Firmicutes bacterium]|nr:urease accessory protein UreE [Bacillota bacterium]